ncbi:MAG: structural protein P5 [Alistipes sp.]|nr:structural protein P5 [Alistipes sp.]
MKSNRVSRGLRNCNPGNIRQSKTRYKGEKPHSTDSAFKQFETLEWGYRAIFMLLHTYRVRGYGDTIAKMISRYAPPFENNTEAYISRVCQQTGIDRDQRLNTLNSVQMIPIVSAISAVENGVKAEEEVVARGWELFITSL